jgi:GTP1/Obg family GTP-binding protein
MGRLFGMLLSLIGYLATATVITIALGIGYLWRTERLTDDKMFRVVALVQGVDLQQIADSQKKTEEEIPAEEPSMEAVVGHQQILDRNYEVKLLELQRGRQEYDHRLAQLKEQSERYDQLARTWQDKLTQQEQITTQENMAKVVSDLEQVKPSTAKDLLMRWISEDRINDVITLLGKMSENKKGKILNSFTTPEELDKLHQIHRLMIESTASKDQLSKALGELKQVGPAAK